MSELDPYADPEEGGGKFKGLTNSQMLTALREGRITRSEFSDEMASRGHSEAAISELLAANPEAIGRQQIAPPSLVGGAGLADIKGLTVEQARAAFQSGQINEPLFIEALEQRGLGERRIQEEITASRPGAAAAPAGPISREQAILNRQQAAREQAAAEANVRGAAQQGFQATNPEFATSRTGFGGLEAPISAAGYTGTRTATYNPVFGGFAEGDTVGFRSPIAGSSLDPRGTWWGTELPDAAARVGVSPAELIERWRSLSPGELAQTIRAVLGREPTSADLGSPPGGVFLQGDKLQRENAAAIAATGAGLPGFGYESRVNPFNPQAGGQAIRLNDAPVMNPEQARQYRALGGFEGQPKDGKTLEELTGVDLTAMTPDRARALASGRLAQEEAENQGLGILSPEQQDIGGFLGRYFGRRGGRDEGESRFVYHLAHGGVGLTGQDEPFRGFERNPPWIQPVSPDWSPAVLDIFGGAQRQQPFQPQEAFNPPLNTTRPYQEGIDRLPRNYANPFAPASLLEQQRRRELQQTYDLGEEEYIRRGRGYFPQYAGSPRPTPLAGPFYAEGGGYVAQGPVMQTDMQTGAPLAVSGEAGREAVISVPLDRPGDSPLIQAIQRLLMGGGQEAAPQPQPAATTSSLLRSFATAAKPRVQVAFGG